MGNTEKVLDYLEKGSKRLCDDCLATVGNSTPPADQPNMQ
jgi:hypothetical protein